MTAGSSELERLPMTMGYFRLILRCFGDTPARRAAILADTGVGESELRDPAAEISLFQQVRQIGNVNAVRGEGWALSQPELWNPTAHGAVGVAVLAAPTLAAGLDVLSRFAHVRAPFFKLRVTPKRETLRIAYDLTAELEEPQWRPMIEIAMISIRAMCAAVLGRGPHEAQFQFACARPAHGPRIDAAFGEHVTFGAAKNAIVIPRSWTEIPSALADASLFRNALSELEAALARLESPGDFRARVKRLLRTMPDGRLNAGAVARALGVSNRTLARKLQSADAQFRALLDTELKARAERLIATRALSRDDMAEKLGYRDPTSFSRACRRWFAPS